jgi:hypothetical protein
MDEDIYIFTTGLEGMIHMWRFNTVSSLAEYVCAYEGHVREVTSILLKGSLRCGGLSSTLHREPDLVRLCGLHHQHLGCHDETDRPHYQSRRGELRGQPQLRPLISDHLHGQDHRTLRRVCRHSQLGLHADDLGRRCEEDLRVPRAEHHHHHECWF